MFCFLRNCVLFFATDRQNVFHYSVMDFTDETTSGFVGEYQKQEKRYVFWQRKIYFYFKFQSVSEIYCFYLLIQWNRDFFWRTFLYIIYTQNVNQNQNINKILRRNIKTCNFWLGFKGNDWLQIKDWIIIYEQKKIQLFILIPWKSEILNNTHSPVISLAISRI